MAAVEQRRTRLVEQIGELTASCGYPPTMRELGTALGYASTASVYKDLSALRDEGRVIWQPGCFRTLRLT